MEDEKELVKAVLAKDEQASEEFVRRFRPRLYAVAVAVLGYQDPEAEDAVQEAFIAALKGLKAFEFRSTLYTWLNQICVRQCFRRIRARRSQLLANTHELSDALGLKAPEEEAPLKMEREEQAAWLKQALEKLEAPCKSLLAGRDGEGLSYAALSRQFKIAIGTVMSRLSRCREKLKAMALKAEGLKQ